jgi:hypothetical protein
VPASTRPRVQTTIPKKKKKKKVQGKEDELAIKLGNRLQGKCSESKAKILQ